MTALPLLWQDEHLVAVHKPPGWLVHRTGLDAGETRIVLQALRDQLGRAVFPVHRLDKGTSGVLLMALDPHAARTLAAAFEARVVRKDYLALVRGWPEAETTVEHALRPDDAPADAPAQPAVTALRRLARVELPVPTDRYPCTRAALVHARPLTGRRHQIRRHLKHLSHPIVGDATHGKGPVNRWWAAHLGLQRLWLHAVALTFPHPSTREMVCVRSPLAVPWLDGAVDALGLALDQDQARRQVQTHTGDQRAAPACGASAEEALNADWQQLAASLPWAAAP